MSAFKARYHPDLFDRFSKAVGDVAKFDDVVREVMSLPLHEVVLFCTEVAFATDGPDAALFRLGMLSGAISRCSREMNGG